MTGESGGLAGERRGDSPTTCEGEGDGGAAGSDVLLSSSVENETVFLRFLSGGTRTTGEEGRGYGGEGGRLVDAAAVTALPLSASPERKIMKV